MKSMYARVIVVIAALAFQSSLLASEPDSLYNRVGVLKGQVVVANNPELGRTPASGTYFLLQRVGCRDCLIGVRTDIDGRYTVYLGVGEYRVYCDEPEREHSDLIRKGQQREIMVRARPNDTEFDIELEVPARTLSGEPSYGDEPSRVAVSLCELEANPQKYAGKQVAVRAAVVGRSDVTIFDFQGTGCTGVVRVMLPSKLNSDAQFQEFKTALRTRSEIEATFEGRFEWPLQDPAAKGNRKLRSLPMRLILDTVRDLRITPTRSVDR